MTMTQDGNRERVGEYIVVEQLQDDLDGSSQVIGYNIRGPGADPTWLYTAGGCRQAQGADGRPPRLIAPPKSPPAVLRPGQALKPYSHSLTTRSSSTRSAGSDPPELMIYSWRNKPRPMVRITSHFVYQSSQCDRRCSNGCNSPVLF
jgi:hypothetical protein